MYIRETSVKKRTEGEETDTDQQHQVLAHQSITPGYILLMYRVVACIIVHWEPAVCMVMVFILIRKGLMHNGVAQKDRSYQIWEIRMAISGCR
jgi:hypothetical protein